MEKKLYKNDKDGQIMGVCQGIGEYFNIDPTLVRVGFVISVLFVGTGLLFYLILGIILPEKRDVMKHRDDTEVYDSYDDY